ncbi:MAG TPA: response regulator transcription factor [Verrucomicrobiae bacterium]|nr:response regulator transcription factor [Verrucomicrobiae bacterium]
MKASKNNFARPIHILIVDDHAIIRDGMKQVLSDAFKGITFGEAENGDQALEAVSRRRWDLVLLDMTMPGKSGLETLDQIMDAQPGLRVLIVSGHPEDQYAVRALKAGAAGYITKGTALEELAEALKQALEGRKYVSASLAENLVISLNTRTANVPHETLSNREFQIMRRFGEGKSPKEIGFDLEINIKTVSTYRARILKKMKLKTNADIIRYAIQHGLVG